MQRVLERAGEQLLREVDREEAGLCIDGLVAGHGASTSTRGEPAPYFPRCLPPDRTTDVPMVRRLFLQLR